MPSFIRRSRKKDAKSPDAIRAAAHPSTPDRTKTAAAMTEKKKSTKGVAKQVKEKNHSSPRGVADDVFSFISDVSSSEDGDSSRQSDESSSTSESSFDDETTYADEPEPLVDLIKHVFSGSNDEDSLSAANADDLLTDNKSKPSYNKLCYRLGLNEGSLVELDIDCGLIEKNIAKEMAKVLPDNTQLQRLCLSCGSDKHHRQIFRILLSGLAENSSVSDLEIRGANVAKPPEQSEVQAEVIAAGSNNSDPLHLDREAASWLGTALAQNQSVQKICLKESRFVESGIAILFLGLQHSTIQELAIQSCNLAGSRADVVSASLPLMKLTSLSLIDTSLTTDGLRFLCSNIGKTPSITQLSLSRNELQRQEIVLLVKSLNTSEHKQLKELILSSCGLDDVCIHDLAKGLKQINTLSTLDLSQNEFGDQGALYLKNLLEKNNVIKELKVDDCKIASRKKLKAIAEGLRYNNSVLKSFGFSATTSLAIFQTVDALEEMGGQIGSSVSEAVNM